MNSQYIYEELNSKTDKQIKAIAKKSGINTSVITEREDLINMIIENQVSTQTSENAANSENISTTEQFPVITPDNIQEIDNQQEKVIITEDKADKPKTSTMDLPLEILDPSPLNFFRPLSPQKYKEVKESIEALGLLQPVLVRPKEDGRYEILAGHNRVNICKDLGWTEITAVIKAVSDDEAEEIIADTNIAQRDNISPLEIARAYEIKAKAIGNRRGQRSDLNGGERFTVRDVIGKEYKVAGRTVEKYMQLNNLIPELKNALADEKIKVSNAFDIGLMDTATQKSLVKNLDMTNDEDVANIINTQNVGRIKKALNEKNALTLEEKKELKRQNKEPKHKPLSKEEIKSILKEQPAIKRTSVKVDLPEDIDVDIMDILKNEPETVVRLLSEYIAGIKSQHIENDN